jgi:hypothetical protein
MQIQCSGKTKTGERCKAWAVAGSQFCISHDPAKVVELAEFRRQGGKGKSNKARARKALPGELMSMAEVQAHLGKALRGVLAGEIEPGVGTAVANIARAMRDVGAAAELEEQLLDMRRQIADLSERRPA